jgi:hypothetical protein
LVLFGARLSLSSAEHFWEARLLANALTEQAWVDRPPKSLGTFAAQVAAFVRRHQARKCPYSLLGPGLEESAWLKTYSPRHKRRLYSAVFGVSRQALDRIASTGCSPSWRKPAALTTARRACSSTSTPMSTTTSHTLIGRFGSRRA